ncbi:MAG TPA: CapA family protein [Gaiella sp.]|uniref:CapA family protein n=1 Tax=Gaiella sp. TaxID=2663207 RepID=UPI002D803120|nr:CapA family protein [Gaiella sp.]HET9288958.1 CapA family protein [Gaiella sp.]
MRVIALIVRAGAVVAASAFVFSLLVDGGPRPATAARPDVQAVEQPEPRPAAKAVPARPKVPPGVVAIVATGDIVMGSTPNLPPDGGRSFFSDVQTDLAGDVVLGNLEGTLSTGGGSKCGARSTDCFAFQTPPSYARWLAQAGFTVMNLANNHAYDFGRRGLEQTIAALTGVGLEHTGRPGQVTVQTVGEIRVALVGFASYPWAASLTDIAAAKRLVRRASRLADVVVVTMHAGAEGRDHQHVTRRTERFLGENRGNVVRFSRAVVDAGADLVVGHGPHVLRGMEWHKKRLIAYSLGNFAGYKVFSMGGPLSTSAILRITLRGDGTFETGRVVPTHLVGPGLPALDPAETAHGMLRSLSREDFGTRAVEISADGILAG